MATTFRALPVGAEYYDNEPNRRLDRGLCRKTSPREYLRMDGFQKGARFDVVLNGGLDQPVIAKPEPKEPRYTVFLHGAGSSLMLGRNGVPFLRIERLPGSSRADLDMLVPRIADLLNQHGEG